MRPILPICGEVLEAALDLGDQVLVAHMVCAGLFGLFGQVALGQHRHLLGLAGAVGQVRDAAHVLVALAGVDAQPDGEVHALREFGRGRLLDELDGLGGFVVSFDFDLLFGFGEARRAPLFADVFSQVVSPVVQASRR
jgi:hypothetical protein